MSRLRVLAGCVLVLLPLASAAAAPRGEGRTAEGEEEEVLERIRWFAGERGFLDPGADHRAMKRARDAAAAETRTRILAMARDGTPRAAWISVGPSPMTMQGWAFGNVAGRLTSLAIDPASPSTLFAGAAAGGLWKTTDGGTSWTSLLDAERSQTVGAVAIAPYDHDEVWAGTGDFMNCWGYYGIGVLRSTDGGLSWEERNGPTGTEMDLTHISSVVLHPTNPAIVIVGGNGIGTSLRAPGADRSATPGHCGGSGTLSGAIYRSTDAGASWAQVATGRVHEVIRDPGNASILYAAVQTTGVIKSTDSGATWTPANTGLVVGADRCEVAISPTSPQTLYFLSDNSRLYRSTDAGASWQQRSSSACDGQCFYNMTLEVHLTNPDILYRGTVLPYRSTNGGTTATPLTDGWGPSQEIHQDIHVIRRHPTDPATFYVGSDGGLWRTTDGGASFTNRNGNLSITQLYDIATHPTLDTVLLGGAQDNSSEAYSGSSVWDIVETTADGFANLIDPVDPSHCYVSSYYGSLARSDTGPAGNYVDISIPDTCGWLTPYVFHPGNPATLYAGCERVWRSTNRGGSWTALTGVLEVGAEASSIHVAPDDPLVIYAGTEGGKLFRSTDGGGSFSDQSAGLPARAIKGIATDPADALHVYLAQSGFGGPHLWVSTTGGVPWDPVTNGLPDIPANNVLVLPGPEIYLATDVGIFRGTSDSGAFAPDMLGFPQGVPVTDIEHNAVTGTLTAGTHGRGAWQRPAGSAAPAADFDGTPRSGPAPLAVSFTDTSTNLPTSWAWDFGDGGTSNVQNPSHTYTGAGSYDVSLTATNAFGSDTETKAGYIVVNGGPPVDAEIVTGAGVDPTNPPVVKHWDHATPPAETLAFTAYGTGGYGVNVAAVSTLGGASAILTGPGPSPSYGPHVRAFDAAGTQLPRVNFYAFGTLKYGCQVAAGDVDGDGWDEILPTPANGVVFGPHVRGFDDDGVRVTPLLRINFFAYSTLRYGVRDAGGDTDGDGVAEILTGAGAGIIFAPHVRVFDDDGSGYVQRHNIFAFASGQYGASVAAGDTDLDGEDELIATHGPDPLSGAQVSGFDAAATLGSAFAFDAFPAASGGAEAAAGDLDADGQAEVVVGRGWGAANVPEVAGFEIVAGTGTAIPGLAFSAYPGQSYGVKVSAADMEAP